MRGFCVALWAAGLSMTLATGCTSEGGGESPADAQPEGSPKPPPKPMTFEELLAQPPPPLGGAGRLVEALAKRFGVGIYRCPIEGGGRMQQIYGTERDRYVQMGPLWDLEIDDATEPPWDHIFDEATAEDHWFTGLAIPGATKSYLRGRSDRSIAFEHPPAVAGETVICTAKHDLGPRTVKGTVKGEKPFVNALVALCADLDAEPTYIKKDGTFEATMPTPCVIWAEQPGYRSEKILVEPGNEVLEVSLTMQRDPLQLEEGGWTEDGKKLANETLAKLKERGVATTAYIEQLKSDFANDTEASRVLARLKTDYWRYTQRVDRSTAVLNAPPPEKKKADVLPGRREEKPKIDHP